MYGCKILINLHVIRLSSFLLL